MLTEQVVDLILCQVPFGRREPLSELGRHLVLLLRVERQEAFTRRTPQTDGPTLTAKKRFVSGKQRVLKFDAEGANFLLREQRVKLVPCSLP